MKKTSIDVDVNIKGIEEATELMKAFYQKIQEAKSLAEQLNDIVRKIKLEIRN